MKSYKSEIELDRIRTNLMFFEFRYKPGTAGITKKVIRILNEMIGKSKGASTPIKIMVRIRPGPPTAAQLAAWDRLWSELAKPPAAPIPSMAQEPGKVQNSSRDNLATIQENPSNLQTKE